MLGPLMIDVADHTLTGEDRDVLQHPLVGGVILFTRNYADPAQVQALIASIRAVRRELLIAVDYEGGRVQRFRPDEHGRGFTRVPPMRSLSSNEHAQHMGWLIARELRAVDADLPFAPVLDIDYGNSEIIGNRAFGGDAATISDRTQAFITGLNAGGMLATGKHFPGHGFVAPDSHIELPVDERAMVDLQADIQPYRDLIKTGQLASVMMAHIVYPQVDSLPASLSRVWVQNILRGDLGFEGAIFCDDLSMGGAAGLGGYVDRAEAAWAAGCDMLPVCNNREGSVQLLDGWRVDVRGAQARATHARLEALRARGEASSLVAVQQGAQWLAAVAAAQNSLT